MHVWSSMNKIESQLKKIKFNTNFHVALLIFKDNSNFLKHLLSLKISLKKYSVIH